MIPINFARVDDTIVMHGAKASRLLKHIEAGNPVCVEATVIDGLVLARSVFHHSINYRSVVLFGKGYLIQDEQEKLGALKAVTEHLVPGRWREARLPNRKELKATSVVSIKIEEASAKVRVGPAVDEEEDYALPVWAGVLPLQELPLARSRINFKRQKFHCRNIWRVTPENRLGVLTFLISRKRASGIMPEAVANLSIVAQLIEWTD